MIRVGQLPLMFLATMIARILTLAAATLTAGIIASACANPSSGHDAAQTLAVFAASSLAESLPAVATAFENENPGVKISFNFAGSQTLRTQLEHGARADVYASADWEQMAAIKKAGLLGNTPEYFAANRITVATPATLTAVATLADLARPDVNIAIAAAEVPAGAYARNALELMATSAEFPDDFAVLALANVVTNETNVRAVAQKVALGEVDAGLIYETDAAADQYAGSFRVIPIPLQFNPAAQYPIAALSTAAHPQVAVDFVAFIQGDASQAILRRFGFAPPTNVACPCAAINPAVTISAVTLP